MNTFDHISRHDSEDSKGDSPEEILNDNQLRNRKKKLKKLLEKRGPEEVPEQEDLHLKIKKLQCMIREYEHGKNSSQEAQITEEKKKECEKKKAKNLRNRRNKKKKREKELLEREAEKNREYWTKYEKEQKIKEEHARKLEEERRKKERERKQREERERADREWEEWKRREEWKQWKRENAKKKQKDQNHKKDQTIILSPKDKLFKDCEIENIPKDMSQLYDSFDKKKYKELTLKYHPDKSEYHDGYIKALNQIKDKHQPVSVKNDETWVK